MGTWRNGVLLASDEAAVHEQLDAASVAAAVAALTQAIGTAHAAWRAEGNRDANAWRREMKNYCRAHGLAVE